MKHLVAMGEALIDFIPERAGKQIKNTENFLPNIGGAPANVCGAYVKLGGEAVMLTKLGEDPFGDKIVDALSENGIDTTHILRTNKANTSLAFVALSEDGNREFSFYRNPGADMLYSENEVPFEVFRECYAFHFCSVSLGDFPMKKAHFKAIEYAKANNCIISFDPNLRPNLWSDIKDLKKAVDEFISFADIIKISDEEVEFITGYTDYEKAAEYLFSKGVAVVLFTLGSDGACVYTKNAYKKIAANKIKPVDTTGAGDGFIGSFLNQLAMDNKNLREMENMTSEEWGKYLEFSDKFCGISIQKKGAINSYITREQIEKL